jgi:quinoprotein glucose dehydrogenase
MSDSPPRKEAIPGDVRGYDVRTGQLRWTFHVVPRARELGVETWKDDSWQYSGHTNIWSLISVDEQLGYAYLPLTSPTSDMYGGHRPGDNLFSDTLVSVECQTGKRVWHYQLVRHDLWDYDLPAAPILADITVDGRRIRSVIQLTKQAFALSSTASTGNLCGRSKSAPCRSRKPPVSRHRRRSHSQPGRQPSIDKASPSTI